MSDYDYIVDLDMTANEVYDTIMERIKWADKMMEKTDDEAWYFRKLGYEEILDDLLCGCIEDTKLPYFKKPEHTDKDGEMYLRVTKQEKERKRKVKPDGKVDYAGVDKKMENKRYNILSKQGVYWVEDKFSRHIDGETFKYRCYDKCRAEALCEILNEQEDMIMELKKFLYDINKSIMYTIDNEKNYGDEYVSEVLQDLEDEFKLDEVVESWF